MSASGADVAMHPARWHTSLLVLGVRADPSQARPKIKASVWPRCFGRDASLWCLDDRHYFSKCQLHSQHDSNTIAIKPAKASNKPKLFLDQLENSDRWCWIKLFGLFWIQFEASLDWFRPVDQFVSLCAENPLDRKK